QDNGTQRTLGTINWSAAFGGDGGEVTFHQQNSNYILGESQGNNVRRSTNNGETWVSATTGLFGYGAWVGPIISHPTDDGVFFTARQQVFKTTDWGSNWSAISSGTSSTIRELAISESSPNIIYATAGGNIYKSTNSGINFSNVTSGLPGRVITSVYVHPDSSNVVVVTLSGFGTGHIYKSTDGAATWQNISGNLPDAPANDVLILPHLSSILYLIATDIGVFITENYGSTWIELAEGLPNTVAMHLDYNSSANEIFVGTHGRGVFKISALFQSADISVSPTSFVFNVPEGGSDSDILTISNIAPAGAQDLNWNITEEVILLTDDGVEIPVKMQLVSRNSIDEIIESIRERIGILKKPIVISKSSVSIGSGTQSVNIEFTEPDQIANVKYFINSSFTTNIAVLGSPSTLIWNDDVQTKLLSTGLFNSVSVINIAAVTPTLGELQVFDAVLVYSDSPGYANSILFGDNLADYVDLGGGVVCAVFSTASIPFGGRFDTDNYWVIPPSSQLQGTREFLGTIYQPSSPLLIGVSSFDGGASSFRQTSFDIFSGATKIADWTDGRALIATRMVGGTDRVDLGFFPPSSDSRSDFWESTTDGDRLMANSLLYVAGTIVTDIPWLSELPISGNIPAGSSQDVDIMVDATGLAASTYNGKLLINSNDPDEPTVTVPVTLNVTPGGGGTDFSADFLVYDNGTGQINLVFGTDPSATEGYDPGIDVTAPPPPPGGFDARFKIPGFDLLKDFRATNPDGIRIWHVDYSTDPAFEPISFSWDPGQLPSDGNFHLVDLFDDVDLVNVDMRVDSSYTDNLFLGHLKIIFNYEVSVIFDFAE
ncbi:MAG: WD40/YVTN/BNR-like repeat-containing protein, partial [Candidatus Heimdallarchaeota archaeon]